MDASWLEFAAPLGLGEHLQTSGMVDGRVGIGGVEEMVVLDLEVFKEMMEMEEDLVYQA